MEGQIIIIKLYFYKAIYKSFLVRYRILTKECLVLQNIFAHLKVGSFNIFISSQPVSHVKIFFYEIIYEIFHPIATQITSWQQQQCKKITNFKKPFTIGSTVLTLEPVLKLFFYKVCVDSTELTLWILVLRSWDDSRPDYFGTFLKLVVGMRSPGRQYLPGSGAVHVLDLLF